MSDKIDFSKIAVIKNPLDITKLPYLPWFEGNLPIDDELKFLASINITGEAEAKLRIIDTRPVPWYAMLIQDQAEYPFLDENGRRMWHFRQAMSRASSGVAWRFFEEGTQLDERWYEK